MASQNKQKECCALKSCDVLSDDCKLWFLKVLNRVSVISLIFRKNVTLAKPDSGIVDPYLYAPERPFMHLTV